MEGMQFLCYCCGQVHTGLPALAYDTPQYYASLSQEDRARAKANDDFCITADGFYFVRAVFEVPIHDEALPLEWGVWGSLSEKNFRRYEESFHDDDQSRIGAMFSYFGNGLGGYPDTLNLHCTLCPQDDRQRPLIVLDPDQDHPLVNDQVNGISRMRAIELALPFLHPQGTG